MPGPNKKAQSFYTNILRSVEAYKKAIELGEKDKPSWKERFASYRRDKSQDDVYHKLMQLPMIRKYFFSHVSYTIYTDQVLDLKGKEPTISEETWVHSDICEEINDPYYSPSRFDVFPTMHDIYQESCQERTDGLCGKIREWMEDVNNYAIKKEPQIAAFHELLQCLEQQRKNTGLLPGLSLFQSTTTNNNQRLYKELLQLPFIKDYFDPSCTDYKLELSFWEGLTRPEPIDSNCRYWPPKDNATTRLLKREEPPRFPFRHNSPYGGDEGSLSINTCKQREGAPYPTHEEYRSFELERELKAAYATACAASNNDDGLCGKLREFLELMDPQTEFTPRNSL